MKTRAASVLGLTALALSIGGCGSLGTGTSFVVDPSPESTLGGSDHGVGDGSGGSSSISRSGWSSRYQQVKDDATPNLDTLHQRPEDIDNALVVTFDENGRMFWQDLGRMWYVDRPSRLTREPIPAR